MGMSKYDRLLHILNLLRARKNLNAARLAEECGVTERSIYRDITALSEANIPIYYDNGYKLASDNFLPPLNFDLDEYNCLRLTLESSPLGKTDKYAAVIRRIQAKIEAGLSDTVKREKKFTPPPTHVSIQTSIDRNQDQHFYSLIEHAVHNYTCLELTYDSIKSGMTDRLVEPYFIMFRGKAFYFVAYCHLRQDFRTFRIDRVRDVGPTEISFQRRRDIVPDKYFEGSWEVYSGEPVEVVVRFTGAAARVILSGTHHPDELVEQTDEGQVVYRVVTRGIEEIQRWILGFGAEAEVLEPLELKHNLSEIGQYFCITYPLKKH